MTGAMFEFGDYVRCINPREYDLLYYGQIYKVISFYHDSDGQHLTMDITGMRAFPAECFELAAQHKPPEIDISKMGGW